MIGQKKILLDYLKSGKRIDKYKAAEMGINNLPARIYDIDDLVEIQSDKTIEYNGKRTVEYWIK